MSGIFWLIYASRLNYLYRAAVNDGMNFASLRCTSSLTNGHFYKFYACHAVEEKIG